MVLKGLSRAIRGAVLVAAAVSLGAADAGALSPSALIVFGDSLSDMGNIDDGTFGFVPGSTYYDGRFSDGPVWVEHLAGRLGVGQLTASAYGGNNFAYGGAQTSGNGGIAGFFSLDVDDQLAEYYRSRTVDPNALYVVWAGANDLFDGQRDVSIPINRIASYLESLMAAGARQFLVPNLPLLGRIPEYNRDPTASAAFDALSHQYNAAFETKMESLAAAHLEATFYRLDVGEIFTNTIANPSAWGLTNVVDPAAPGLDPGMFFYNKNRIVPNRNQYLFWDTIHPTAVVHSILGDYSSRLLEGLAGDFDTDGEVDAADYRLWRSGFGVKNAVIRQGDADGDKDVDGADLLAWQRSLGVTLAAPPRATAVVPEPASVGLLAGIATVVVVSRRHRVGRER